MKKQENRIRLTFLLFLVRKTTVQGIKAKKECLSPDLSIRKMWKLFCNKYPESSAKLHVYRDIFNSELKLRFDLPRSDTCGYCEKLHVQLIVAVDEHTRLKIETDSKFHHML